MLYVSNYIDYPISDSGLMVRVGNYERWYLISLHYELSATRWYEVLGAQKCQSVGISQYKLSSIC